MAKLKKVKEGQLRKVKCMNSDPMKSKWGNWAPVGGCTEVIEVDENCARALCWRCTNRVMSRGK